MQLDFNKPLLSLDGREIQNGEDKLFLGKIFANALVSVSKGDLLKHWDWAVAMHKGEPIEVDKSDMNKLRLFVESSDSMTILAKKQLLDIINQAEK